MSHCLFFLWCMTVRDTDFFFLINSFFEKDNFNVYNNKICKWTELGLLSGWGKKWQYIIDRVGVWFGTGPFFNIWVSNWQPSSMLAKETGGIELISRDFSPIFFPNQNFPRWQPTFIRSNWDYLHSSVKLADRCSFQKGRSGDQAAFELLQGPKSCQVFVLHNA